MRIKNRCISRFEIEILFRNIMNLEQQEKISQLCKLLGKYMVLDRKMLEERALERIGLSYIARAVRYGFLSEFEYDNQYFFQLGASGVSFLEMVKSKAFFLPLDITRYDRQRILTANRYMLDNNLDFDMNYHFLGTSYFICEGSVIIYFDQVTTRKKAAVEMSRLISNPENIVSPEEIFTLFDFSAIDTPIVEIGKKAKGLDVSHLEAQER